jgi:hypothetical protein
VGAGTGDGLGLGDGNGDGDGLALTEGAGDGVGEGDGELLSPPPQPTSVATRNVSDRMAMPPPLLTEWDSLGKIFITEPLQKSTRV